MFTIATDPTRRLLRITLEGFWDKHTFERFKREARDAALTLPGEPGDHYVIADASRAAIQSQEVADMLAAYMTGKTFRFAFVTGNAVIKIQARRLFKESGVIIVDTVEEAEHALFQN
ncbi:MAG TPA: hypothetical protein VF489_04625 [Sphingobium sp.]